MAASMALMEFCLGFALPVLVQVVAQHVAQRGCRYRPFLGAQLLDVLAALHGKADIARREPRIRQMRPRC